MSGATYGIIGGPTAEAIWDHAKHSQNKMVSQPLRFRTDHTTPGAEHEPYWLEPTITGVTHLDDTGHMLHVTGFVPFGDAGGRSRFTGFYDDRVEKGSFIFGA
jgi:hypothetical protein